MAVKRFAPVRVINPLSDMHMVYVHPNQPFTLELSSWMGVQHVELDSEFFKMESIVDCCNSQHFTFEPILDLSDWTKCSNTYLGEITLISEEVCTILCIVLLSENPYVLTLINPTSCEIKVQPHQILEFIFWGNHAEAAAEARTVTCGHLGLLYKEQGREEIIPSNFISDVNVTPGDFVVRQRNAEQPEWHYWYSISDELICKANNLPNAIYHGGKISFGSDTKRTIYISLSVKKREPKKRHEQQVSTYSISANQPKIPKLTKQNFKYTQHQYKWQEPSIAEVEISYKGETTLTDGCQVIDLNELKGYIKDEQLRERAVLARPSAYYIHDYD